MARGDNGNFKLAKGINRFSRFEMYHKKNLWKKTAKKWGGEKKVATATPKVKDFNKKEKRTILPKGPSSYDYSNSRKVVRSGPRRQYPTKLRSSLTPGTVIIIVAGKFAGRRAVFLKQLPSGLLLVTGPFRLNGVPLRRFNQAFVIATSTKIDVSKLKVDDKYTDAFFAKDKKAEKAADGAKVLPAERVEAQKAIDSQLLDGPLKGQALLSKYLGAHFTLRPGQYPHMMKF